MRLTNNKTLIVILVIVLLNVFANYYSFQVLVADLSAISGTDRASLGGLLLPSRSEYAKSMSAISEQQSPASQVKDQNQKHPVQQHRIAGLSCGAYGGPNDDVAAEMVYWKDIDKDAAFISPLKPDGDDEYYLTFELDEAGWNNIRMAMETNVAIAASTGRTLVLPPKQSIWNFGNSTTDLREFFHFKSIQAEHVGLKIIDFQEFLERTAMKGQLVEPRTGQASFPPQNRTDWSGIKNYESVRKGEGKVLWTWMRSVSMSFPWQHEKCVAAFPSDKSEAAIEHLQQVFLAVQARDPKSEDRSKRVESYLGRPTPVHASATNRLREMMADRNELCVYDKTLQHERFLHLLGEQASGHRFLTPFYTFLFFPRLEARFVVETLCSRSLTLC